MERIVGDFATNIIMEENEPRDICRLGQGEKTCAFLAATGEGFTCIRMAYPSNGLIFARLEEGTMNAKGRGEWEGCPWAPQEATDGD